MFYQFETMEGACQICDQIIRKKLSFHIHIENMEAWLELLIGDKK